MQLKRMAWYSYPILKQRTRIKPPLLRPLPPLSDIELREPAGLHAHEPLSVALDDPDALVDSDEMLQ